MRARDFVQSFPPPGTLHIEEGGAAGPLDFGTPATQTTGSFGGCADDTGLTLYAMARTGAPYLNMYLQDHVNKTLIPLTLSGFGTFTGAPTFYLLGYDTEANAFWIVFTGVGGSGSITANLLYPVTISGGTITLGAAATPPAVAGKAVCTIGSAHNGKIVVVYYDTSNFRLDTARVYDISGASWAAPSGGNSPYAVNTGCVLDAAATLECTFGCGGQSDKTYFISYSDTASPFVSKFIEFDFSTETFADKSGKFPQCVWNAGTTTTGVPTMAIDPSGNYVIGYLRSSALGTSNANYVWVYDRANDVLLSFTPTAYVSWLIAGDESSGNAGYFFCDTGTTEPGLPMSMVSVSGSGVFCGVVWVGQWTYSDSGGDGGLLFWNIDGAGMQKAIGTQTLWDKEGYKKIMANYTTSLVVLFVGSINGGTYDAAETPKIYYTTN